MRDTDIVTFTGITDTDTDTDEHANTDTDFVTDSFEFEKESHGYCACSGDCRITFYRGGKKLTSVSYHHGISLRWNGGKWDGDSLFTPDSQKAWRDWFKKHGEPRFQDWHEAEIKGRKYEEERKARTVKRESEEREVDLRGESIATRSPSSESRTISRRGRHTVLPNRPKEVHWSTKGKGKKGKRNKGKGEGKDNGQGEQRDEGGETRPSGQVGGWSNKQRLYNLEHDQEDNVANSERMRNDLYELSCKVAMRSDLYELTCKVARMAQTIED